MSDESKEFKTNAFIIFSHIYVHLLSPYPSRLKTPPLFVALQGPQGSGKTSLSQRVTEMLSEDNGDHAPIRVASLSVDDLYLPHTQLKALAAAHPNNPFLRGRGLPGTHDITLGLSLFRSLKNINLSQTNEIRIPRFDKSLFDGEGDRLPESEWTSVQGPLDVVLLEGWCVGFYPQSRRYIEERINEVPFGLDGMFDTSAYSLEHVFDANERLAEYTQWWDLFDICVQISPQPMNPFVPIYKWRLEQEHEMKAKNDGQGMTDEQVKMFVDRYIPGYHFFLGGVTTGGYDQRTGSRLIPPWLQDEPSPPSWKHPPARCLRMIIDQNRRTREIAYCRRE
ncbi:P-loop containing nucleoside triphosphate hydrolase protein [Russula earlei]|uniref:P-loop containing nucleoside triphosphate hydrolase protein n=1 Tax=Russula earlei TaxID=71964 RepID=A0ACC0U0Z4_9AGAM|nr:P-loop containing nucleoside triphosphate hydrolase protein [Russula earlei]